MLHIESLLCMAVAEPLCLSPNPALGELAANRDRAAKQKQSVAMQRTLRRLGRGNSKVAAKRAVSESAAAVAVTATATAAGAEEFKLHEFLRKKSRLGRAIPAVPQVILSNFLLSIER